MEKDFDARNEEKKYVSELPIRRYPQAKEIWNVKLWLNVWEEENGRWWFVRPVLVVKRIGSLVFCVPMTTQIRYTIFSYELTTSSITDKKSALLLSQWRVLDRRRFRKQIGHISSKEFLYIKKLIHRLYL
jgi:mRNA interferase MazF